MINYGVQTIAVIRRILIGVTTFFLLLVVSINVNAVNKTKIDNTKIIYTSVTKQQLMETEVKFFGITKEEYTRAKTYQSLALEMDKNNTLSTLEILGVYAETKAEKRKYARKFAKLFHQYTDKVLSFQKLVMQENKRLTGDQSMFDYTRVQKEKLQSKRISKIIDINDCDDLCKADVKKLIEVAFIFPVDLYFKNTTNLEIQRWASELAIKSDEVDQGFITLNHAY